MLIQVRISALRICWNLDRTEQLFYTTGNGIKRCVSLIFAWGRFRSVRRLRSIGDGGALAGHRVFLIYPAAKIDEFATFRTKRAMRIMVPLDRFVTGGTFHGERIDPQPRCTPRRS